MQMVVAVLHVVVIWKCRSGQEHRTLHVPRMQMVVAVLQWLRAPNPPCT